MANSLTLIEPPQLQSAAVEECDVPASPASAQSAQQITDEFTGTFEPTEVSLGYRIGLVLVSVAMMLLLAVYVGIIVLSAYAIYYHLTAHSAILDVSSHYVSLFVYLWPAAAGIVLVFFMVKPILAGRPERPPRYSP